jgi:NADH-quinone oxidoreductase subunit E
MSVRRLAEVQPEGFAFSAENLAWAREQIAKYPQGRQQSAVIPLLWRAQKQSGGWLPEPAIRHVGDLLGMAYIRVLEVATFYTMFNLEPVGRHYVQLCGTTPCWLRGADDLKAVCRKVIGPEKTVSADGALSWIEVECLGACVNAPMVQINEDFYEDLTPARLETILDKMRADVEVPPGSQTGRQTSAPEGGPITLKGEPPYTDAPARSAADDDKHLPEPIGKLASRTVDPEREPAGRASGVETAAEGVRPEGLATAREGGADDLKKISGVGPKIEGILHSLGIFHFDQIAQWAPENVDWVDAHLRFKGRIGRENWIEQARTLAGQKNEKPEA